MRKFLSLLKASMAGELNIFKIKNKNTSSKISKAILPIFLTIAVMFSVGSYAYLLAEQLAPMHLTYIMLTMFIVATVLLTIIEGIYKSQGMLFDVKDNDLLFSLPIKKSNILFSRMLKLIAFQYLYNSVFILPALATYIMFEKPGIMFYLVSIVMIIILPIIPTIIACFVGYIIKGISSVVKFKKVMQTILSTILCLAILWVSFNMQNVGKVIVQNATSINEIISKLYLPAGLYIEIIQNFSMVKFIELIAINIVPLIIFVYIASILYFKIISKSSEASTSSIKKNKKTKTKIRAKKPINALILKELKRYFSSPIYIFNTGFGLILIVVFTIGICTNLNGVIETISKGQLRVEDKGKILEMLPQIYMQAIMFMILMTQITASSISIEGKSFEITKSLPISTEKIFLAKIMSSNIITMPLLLISDIIFVIAYKVQLLQVIYILLMSLILPNFVAIEGLLINLIYPKMDANSDVEIVKQSTSTMISIFLGMGIGIASIVLTAITTENNMATLFEIGELLVFVMTTGILYLILKKNGTKRFNKINV